MKEDDLISPAYFDMVSQFAHLFTTAFISLVAWLFFGAWAFAVTGPGIAAYGAWHEFVFEPRYNNRATRGSDVEDFLFLVGGIVLAGGVAVLKVELCG